MRFSHKPWLKLLEMYSEEGDLQRSLQAAIRVAAYQYADYGEMTVRFWMTPGRGGRLTYYERSSILRPSPDAFSNWVRPTDTKKFLTRSSAWGFLTTSGKRWRATCFMGRSSRLRVTTFDKTRAPVFSSFTLVDSLVTGGHCHLVPSINTVIYMRATGSQRCGSVSDKQLCDSGNAPWS